MIRINLLPVRQIKQRIRTRQEVVGLAIVLLVLLGIMALIGIGQGNRISALQDETARLNQEKAKYKAIIAQIDKLKKDQQVIENKLNVIKTLKVASQLPTRLLDEIATITPSDRMWLKSFEYARNSIVLGGTALDNATIAEYMDKITNSDFFAAAELKNSSLAQVGKQKLKSFSLTISTVASAEPMQNPPAKGSPTAKGGKK